MSGGENISDENRAIAFGSKVDASAGAPGGSRNVATVAGISSTANAGPGNDHCATALGYNKSKSDPTV